MLQKIRIAVTSEGKQQPNRLIKLKIGQQPLLNLVFTKGFVVSPNKRVPSGSLLLQL